MDRRVTSPNWGPPPPSKQALIRIFGHTLDEFLAYSPFLPKFPFFAQNLPFSYNRHLSSFPSSSPHLTFWQTFDGFLPNSPVSPICHFRENHQLPIGLFCSHLIFWPDLWWILDKFANFAKYVIFIRPTIIDMPLVKFVNRKVKKLKGRIRHFHIFHKRPCFAKAVFNFLGTAVTPRRNKVQGVWKNWRGGGGTKRVIRDVQMADEE